MENISNMKASSSFSSVPILSPENWWEGKGSRENPAVTECMFVLLNPTMSIYISEYSARNKL